LRKCNNSGLENSCPKIRLKPISVKGLMNFAIEIQSYEFDICLRTKIHNIHEIKAL
jgi:hypothetical protein